MIIIKKVNFFFKKSIKNILPEYVLKRKKKGFSPPAKKWFKHIFDQHGNLLKDGFLKKLGILDDKKLFKTNSRSKNI